MNNSQARVEEIFAEAARLFEAKNATYQDAWREQGWRGNLSRILEKTKRLRAMLWRGGNVLLNGSNEHPRETLLDILNTCTFAIINMDDGIEWGHETKESYSSAAQTPVDFPNELASYTSTLVPYDEKTRTDLPIVGEVPTPGEDVSEERRPSPRKRGAAVTDRGSGPRQKPQA